MYKLTVNSVSGEIFLDDSLIKIDIETNFLATAKVAHKTHYNGYHNYSFAVNYLDYLFDFFITFHNGTNPNASFGLIWKHCLTDKKGYAATKKDIIKDIHKLMMHLETVLKISATSQDCNQIIYKFLWGNLTVGGALLTPTVSITFSYL